MKFLLKQQNDLLGTLHFYDTDFPWTNCKFEPTEAFQKVKPLFDEELKILDAEDWGKWDEAYSRIISLNLKLINTEDGKIIDDFLLHIQNDEAWFHM